MREIQLSSDQLVKALLNLPDDLNLCLLDSCGVSYLNSHLLIAGINPIERIEFFGEKAETVLKVLDDYVSKKEMSGILTIPYDFGLKINQIESRHSNPSEPDIFLALFDVLIIHNYLERKTYLTGNKKKFAGIEKLLVSTSTKFETFDIGTPQITSNFTKSEYLKKVVEIQELIRSGDTYQTNLTQQIRAKLPDNLRPETIYRKLRVSHPAAFSSFIRRKNDVVISASPERFLKVEGNKIFTSPIKGTRPRGSNLKTDLELKNDLLNSEKDRAENIMIVDLLRNDIGKICEFGTVKVEKLCDLEEHPTLFHLVSTISGKLRPKIKLSDILQATFPCGSITGAPKYRTMQIIDRLETMPRGLSMGAIGVFSKDIFPEKKNLIDLSVAIRTMTIRNNEAAFSVGGGIVIDSVPETEFEETLTKAKALLKAIGVEKI